MNTSLSSYAKDHFNFCRNFLEEKTRSVPSPKIETLRLPQEEKSKPSKLKLLTNIISPPVNSKLIEFKNRIKRALKNRDEFQKNYTTRTETVRKASYRRYSVVRKMPPILENNIKMFGNKIKRIGYLNDLSWLNPKYLKFFNDQSYYDKKKTWFSIQTLIVKNSYFLTILDSFIWKILNFFKKIKKIDKCALIHPYGKIKILWDLLVSLLIILLIFYIPLSLSFSLSLLQSIHKTVIFIVFFMDMILEINTIYFHNGMEVQSRVKIIWNYFKGYFNSDLISLCSLFFQMDGPLSFLFFMKVFSLAKFSKKITNRFQFSRKWKGVKDLIVLFLLIIFIAHIAACGWYYVGINSPAENWIKDKGLLYESWQIKYMSSFYWSIVTVMTVGYGDITPANYSERLYCLLVILFGGMIFPYSINSIGNIIQDIKRDDKKFEDTLDIINAYMKRKKISAELQTRIREYLNFIWNEEKTQNIEEEEKIINSLSASLKEELNLESFGFFVKKNPLFIKFFSEDSLKKMVNAMKEIFFTPGDMIFQQNQREDNPAIYFIVKGTVKIYSDLSKNPIVLKEFKAGEYFGQRSFFTNLNRENTAVSSKFSTLFMITQNDFLSLIKQNKSDYENFCMIREKLVFCNDYSYIQKSCFCCGRYTHIIEDCPKLHYIPNIERIIKKFMFPQSNHRLPFHRKTSKSKNSRKTYAQFRIPDFHKNVAFEELEKQEESNFEVHEESEDFENNDHQQISKKEMLNSFSLHKNPTQTFLKPLEKEPSSPSILVSYNNDDQSKTKSFQTTKQTSSEQIAKSLKNLDGTPIISEAKLPEMTTNFEIDKICNFKRYFPSFNIKQIIKNYENLCDLGKEIQTKFTKRYKQLKNYTFFEIPILEKFLSEKKEKHKQNQNFKRGMLVRHKSIRLTNSPLAKKSFFDTHSEKKKEFSNFTDLISVLVLNNRSKQKFDSKFFVKSG